MAHREISPTMRREIPPATLRLRIDAQALASNWRALDQMSGKARAGAAVKANCYGLGVDQCVPALRDAGSRDFFVAHWQEVPALLAHVPPEQISVLHGVMTREEVEFARASGVRPVINSIGQAKNWVDTGSGACDLMVDTGINRLGVSMNELSDPAIQSLKVSTLMSHLACADEDVSMNARQLSDFAEARQRIEHEEASLANSAGIALGADFAFDLTRPGLSLYGGVPRGELSDTIKQVAQPEAAILQTRMITAGETVGYNATFTASRDMRVGVVSLGYADGLLRGWGNRENSFSHNGKKLLMLGKVSMDMIVVDLTDAPELSEGDWLALPYDLPKASEKSGLSQYELLTVLGQRFASS